tara:strand:+ start:3569 stop:5953 length:2385 start_codon:yes stop_codon:yes gene_type:complete
MIIYILKATACLAIFLAFYKLFLEKEIMHIFKRFYLLLAIVIAFTIPTILFTEYIYIVPQPIETNEILNYTFEEFHATPEVIETNRLPILLWSIYAFGVLAFGFKFFQNLFTIRYRIRKNPKIKNQHITNVLLKEKLAPHTFFNFIFLNKQKFESQEIPEEVLLHEKTHAQQKHSIDVLFIEFLQVVLWFNPLIYLFKKSIKLNHEFLADQAVMRKGVETTSYQKILLAFSSNAPETQLANAINYSSIKKRFTVMKKHTSKKAVWLRSLFVLPLFALLLYSFSATQVLEIERPLENDNIISNINEGKFSKHIEITIDQDGVTEEQLSWYNSTIKKINEKPEGQRIFKLEDVQKLEHIYNLMSEKQKTNAEDFPRFPPPPPPMDTIYTYERLLKRIKTNPSNRTSNIISLNKLYDNMSLLQREKVENPDAVKNLLPQDGATEAQISEYNAITSKYSDMNMHTIIKKSEIVRMEQLYNLMTEKQKRKVSTYTELQPMPQEQASTKQISEYNTLAKKYNKMDPNNMWIQKSEVDRMKYIYSIMTEKQKKEAEAYPDIPPMPEPPMPPTPPLSNRLLEQEKALNKQEEKLVLQEKVLIEQEKKIERLEAPPSPPTPKSPLDHVIEMAKKGAIFYYEDKEISSDKAIEILKNNTNLNIDTRKIKSSKPVVKISKEPIIITSKVAVKNQETVNIKDEKKDTSDSIKKKRVSFFVNGSSEDDISLTKLELENIILELEKGKITKFRIKFPGKLTVSVFGNKLNQAAKDNILESISSDVIQIFDIKTDIPNLTIAPKVITLK